MQTCEQQEFLYNDERDQWRDMGGDAMSTLKFEVESQRNA